MFIELGKKSSMSSSKFVELYSKMTEKEKRQFQDFGRLEQLYLSAIDRKALNILSRNSWKATEIENRLFDNLFETSSKENNKAYTYIKNHLLKAIISFLKWKQAEQSIESDIELLHCFYEKGVKDNFEYEARQLDKQRKKKSLHYFDSFYTMKYNEILLVKRESRNRDNVELSKTDDALDVFFVINKLRLYCKKLNESNIVNRVVEEQISKLFDFIEIDIEKHNHPLILLYRQMVEFLKDQDNQMLYDETFEIVKKHEDRIADDVMLEIYGYLKNRCSYYFNKGIKRFAKSYIDLIQHLEDRKILLSGGLISSPTFKNAITSALVYEDFDWTEQFMNKYISKIGHIDKKVIEPYHQANFHYYKGKLDKSLDILAKMEREGVTFKDPRYRISYNRLFIKIYLQKSYMGEAYGRIETFSRYIHGNKKISKEGKKQSLEFAKVAKKICLGKKINPEEYLGKVTVADYWWLKKLVIVAK
jgi:hypothetical protein